MAREANQKLKLLMLQKILMENTDENHGLSAAEIISRLAVEDISVNRKILYQDFEELRHFGVDIISEKKGRNVYYYIGSREFELPELKLLVDSVQSAKFITEKKSNELIGKLEGLVSKYEARQLHRQVIISGRVKSMNESIYYNVDKIQTAIGENVSITFAYFQWNVKKEMVLRHDGMRYEVSPWALAWDDENYYMIAYDHTDERIKHYRVDKMVKIILTSKPRKGQEKFDEKNSPKYSQKLFSMFGGEPVRVSIEADDSMAGVFIDRFGKDIMIVPKKDGRFRLTVEVEVSDHFLGWIIALGPSVVITGPPQVTERMKEIAETLKTQYL
ncbi:MAG: WYL domain-containing protein [Eubacterium sp.]|nr:WYL domain-containing protein [Eubacterium sp.]